MTEVTKEYIIENSNNVLSVNRLIVLENYINLHGRNPTEKEYWSYNEAWYAQSAKVVCSICGSVTRRDNLNKHKTTKKCKQALIDSSDD